MKTVIEHFKAVRDIPYSIPLSGSEEDCCCNGKARKLRGILEQEGFKVRYRVCTFRWSDLDVPEKILSLSNDDLSTHVYLEVLIDGDWIVVDPTWDSKLKSILPVNDWDGKGDTSIAVTPVDTYSIKKSDDIMSRCESRENAPEDASGNKNFEAAFNDWLAESRR